MATVALVAAGCSDDDKAADRDWQQARSVTVVGTGKVLGAPDQLRATIGVQATGADVSTAVGTANEAAKALTDAVKKDGVDPKDVQTQDVSISPQYNNPAPGGNQQISGYQASTTLTLVLRTIDTASTVLDHAIAAGGNAVRLNGIQWVVDDDSALIADARSRAFADAKSKGEQYATLGNATLGKVITISEDVSQQNPASESDFRSGAVAPLQLEPGRQTVSVNVTVKWELG